MRVMLDTNIIISTGIFSVNKSTLHVFSIADKYDIVLSTQIIEELYTVIERKFQNKKPDLERFLNSLNYDVAITPKNINDDIYPKIRDKKDYPILASAIIADVDVFITDDKDFNTIDIERPKIMTLFEFAALYL